MTSILQNWHFSRILRAVFAVYAIAEAARTGQQMLYFIGGLFAFQAIFNVGCCGAAGCAPPQKTGQAKTGPKTEDAVFEEIK